LRAFRGGRVVTELQQDRAERLGAAQPTW
jgi:hypothetical protein